MSPIISLDSVGAGSRTVRCRSKVRGRSKIRSDRVRRRSESINAVCGGFSDLYAGIRLNSTC